MRAGKLLGTPGKTGKVYDTCTSINTKDKDTLCNYLQNTQIIKIDGYDFNLKKHNLEKTQFIKVINNTKNIVTKEYYSESANEDFHDELEGINKIYSYFKKDIDKYTTLGSVVVYDSIQIIGVCIYFLNAKETDHQETDYKKMFITFQGKCNTRFREYVLNNKLSNNDVDIFLKNILDAISILQVNNIAHCDIKFDNIMTANIIKKMTLYNDEMIISAEDALQAFALS